MTAVVHGAQDRQADGDAQSTRLGGSEAPGTPKLPFVQKCLERVYRCGAVLAAAGSNTSYQP